MCINYAEDLNPKESKSYLNISRDASIFSKNSNLIFSHKELSNMIYDYVEIVSKYYALVVAKSTNKKLDIIIPEDENQLRTVNTYREYYILISEKFAEEYFDLYSAVMNNDGDKILLERLFDSFNLIRKIRFILLSSL